MRRFTIVLAGLLSLLLLLPLGACGGSSGGGSTGGGASGADGVRAAMRTLVLASLNDDLSAARPHLDVPSYLVAIRSSDLGRVKELSEEELLEHARGAFNQLKAVRTLSTIKDESGLDAALSTAHIDVLSQTAIAKMSFQAPDNQGSGQVTFKARMSLYTGTKWKLVSFDPEF